MRYIFFLSIVYFSIISLNAEEQLSFQDIVVKKEEEIPPTEDLMREHGVLNRLLLIYEEVICIIDRHTTFPTDILLQTTHIMQSFIEQYHEKLEEEYIFPLFEKNNRELSLIRTLKEQHSKGRKLTSDMRKKLLRSRRITPRNQRNIKKLLQIFIKMYRPHEAREDTVLFPQVRSLLSEEEFKKLGELFEDREHALFGPNGFETIVEQVAEIEKMLGIYALDKFTP